MLPGDKTTQQADTSKAQELASQLGDQTVTLATTRWDSAQYLKTDEDMELYLEACLEEAGDDPAFIVHALGVVARARNMSQLARDTGLSRVGCSTCCYLRC